MVGIRGVPELSVIMLGLGLLNAVSLGGLSPSHTAIESLKHVKMFGLHFCEKQTAGEGTVAIVALGTLKQTTGQETGVKGFYIYT